MNRTVSIGVNSVPKYLYYIPLIKWAWNKLAWDTHIFYVGDENDYTRLIEKTCNDIVFPIRLRHCYGYPSETISQTVRFYAYDFTGQLIMTSDSDMIPLSDYWNPKDDEITCYGRDLSNEHYPACYVAMPANHWRTVMNGDENQGIRGLKCDLDFWYPKAKNKWTVDQNILTDRLNTFHPKTLVNRGVDSKTHYPVGRVDRSGWSLNHKQLIDCHAPHDILTNEKSFHNVMQLLHTVWPSQDWKWFIEYHRNFKKLL
jgi:hypothetical protein